MVVDRLRKPLLCLAALALAGCGSTVQARGGLTGDGFQAPADGIVPTQPVSTAGPANGPLGRQPAAGPIGVGDPRAPGQPAPHASGPAPGKSRFSDVGYLANPPGLSATEIAIGIQTVNAYDAVSAAFGVGTGESSGNMQRQWNAVIADLNERGGIAGRRVVPVFNDVNIARLVTDGEAEAQAQCTAFTADHKVYAVLSLVGFPSNTWLECLAKAHTALINPDISYDRTTMDRYPDTLFSPAKMNLTRLMRTLVPALHQQGWFGRWDTFKAAPGSAPVKIGLLNAPGSDAMQKGLKPALAALGYRVDTEFTVSATSITELQGQYKSAVLKFSSEHVTHVFGGNYTFAKESDGQKYYPRLTISTLESPATNAKAKNYPATSLLGMMGLGFAPLIDSLSERGDISPAAKHCDAIMRAAGEIPSGREAMYQHHAECEAGYFLQTVLRPGIGDPHVLRQSVEATGRTFVSSVTYRTEFEPGQRDGVAAYRNLRYDKGCTCFVYSSALRPA
jgi:hypothetical protein